MITHDKKKNSVFFYWLSASLFLLFIMIIVGGLTRLTNSGLSITEWELFKGILPPLTQSEWNNYFSLYKQIPQFNLINPNMDLNEFKIIYYWEYIHRILGRLIGLFFLIPIVYFQFIKKINFRKLFPYYLILLLIIFQGIIGWYMVKSGLVNEVTVSHYRLSLHLIIAVTIISIIFWEILNLKYGRKSFFNFSKKELPYLFLICLLFIQIIFGAFVSGLDAGKIYQTWPLMGNTYFPDDFIFGGIINFFNLENHSLVQFYHRNIAYFIFFYILVLSFFIFKNNENTKFKPLFIMISVLFIQVLLGIFTLLTNLHIVVASTHQITSVILVLATLNLYYSIIK